MSDKTRNREVDELIVYNASALRDRSQRVRHSLENSYICERLGTLFPRKSSGFSENGTVTD